MVSPEDQKKLTPFRRECGLRIPDKYQRIGVVLVSQFKAETVDFVFDMPGQARGTYKGTTKLIF